MSQEIIDRLNELLEVERAGVGTALKLTGAEFQSCSQDDLTKFGEDEGWACSGLRRAILRYGGIPSRDRAPSLRRCPRFSTRAIG